ncbi:MAG: DsrE family protein, partial [Chromatiales bacterium]
MRSLLYTLAFLLACPALVAPAWSADAPPRIDDSAALADLEEAKAVFLIDFTNPKKTAFYLEIIRGTHQGLRDQGVEPDMILVYIGETVRYLTTEPDELLDMEFGAELKSIAESVEKLDALGVRQEVCAVACDVFGVDPAKLLPGLTPVGDGFISLIGWQSQGYHLV